MRQWENDLLEQLLHVQDFDLKIRGVEMKIAALYDQSMRDDPRLCKLKADAGRIEESIETSQNQQEMYLGTLEDIRGAIQGLISTRAGAFKLRTRSSTEALKVEEGKLVVLVKETEERIQKLREELAAVKSAILARSREVQVAQQAPEAEIRKLRNRVRRLEKQREEAVVGIPQMLLRKYERLRNSRSGIGLTIMRDGVCVVCRMQMPTGIRFRLFRGETISACPACGRMVARIENPEATRLGLATVEGGPGGGWSGGEEDGDEYEDERVESGRVETTEDPATRQAKKPAAKKPAAKKPAAEKPAAKKPAAEKPAAKKPAAEKPAAKKPAAEKPAAKKPAAKKPAAKKPAAKKPAAKKPAAKKPAAKKPAAKKPAAKKPAAKKPAAKKPAAKKPAAKKPADSKAKVKKKTSPGKKTRTS